MAEFLEGYGAGDERREKLVKWVLVLIALALVTAGADWILGKLGKANLSDIREQWRARSFVNALKDKDYDRAYRLWGCDPSNPCRDYTREKFLEDWGPNGLYRDASSVQTEVIRHCDTGIIQTLRFGRTEPVSLWVNSGDLTVGFAPWPVCQPRWQAP